MLHMDHQVPVLEELSVLDRHDVTLTFNEEVEVLSASFDGLEAETWPAAPGVIQVHSSDELHQPLVDFVAQGAASPYGFFCTRFRTP